MAQHQTPDHSGESITIMRIQPRQTVGLTVTTTSQDVDGKLEDRHSAYHDNLSPPLRWTAVPGAVSYALIVEDPDAPMEQPFVHWMIWNIPGETTSLPQGMPNNADPITPQGAIQGRNDNGSYGWFGPRPPAGHGVHRYYFQLFALDQHLEMDADTPLEELVNALKGDVIAEGQLVATYEAPTSQ